MNEGHSTLVVLALLEEQTWGRGFYAVTNTEIEAARQRCAYWYNTCRTHTSMPVLREVEPDTKAYSDLSASIGLSRDAFQAG